MVVIVIQRNGTRMIVIIKAVVVVSVQIVVVMEGANIFPLSAETVPL